MKIAVIYNQNIQNSQKVLNSVEKSLSELRFEYEVFSLDNLRSGYDFVCTIGGDGTILKTSRFYAKDGTPVMGVNLGRLGFLSLILPEDACKVGFIIDNKDYTIENRMMLEFNNHSALNDFVIKGHSPIRTSKFNLYINDKLVSDYIADGIIVSTPTGSTAYGLSAGGPILYPSLETMVIVPICAHTMTARPLVVPATERITIKSVDELLDVSCDGQENLFEFKEVNIIRSKYKAQLAFPNGDNNFYSILRNKLHWGISPVSVVS